MLFQGSCIRLYSAAYAGGTVLGAALKQGVRGLRRAVGVRARHAQQQVDDELLPKVALVGRPNVGKSALFNRLLRRRAALVYDTPTSHVTRDYQEGRAQLGDLVFRAADTSGLEPRSGGSGWASINARATSITATLLRQCHLTLLLVDAKDGILPGDEEVANWLSRTVPRDQVLVVANKAEGARAREEMPQTVYDCYRLGFGEPVAVSATTGEGLADLYTALQPHIDTLTQQLVQAKEARERATSKNEPDIGSDVMTTRGAAQATPIDSEEAAASDPPVRLSLRQQRRSLFGDGSGLRREVKEPKEADDEIRDADGESDDRDDVDDDDGAVASGGHLLKLAIMGLPNAGKSTLLNRLLGEQRALTGPEPGLTRDAVHAFWMYGNQPVELVDTSGWIGVGRTGRYDDVGGDVAAMSREATLRSLAQVHVAVLVVDVERALRGNRVLARRELSLAAHVIREGKALVLVANKIDVLTPQQRALYSKSLHKHLSEKFLGAGQLPVVEVSAREGVGLDALMPTVTAAYAAWNKRVGTARLNTFVAKLSARMAGGGGADASLRRIRYMTQIKTRPPTFVAFLRGTALRPVSSDISAFLAHQIREVLGFPGVPLRIWFRYRDRIAERKSRSVSIRSRRGQAPGNRSSDKSVDARAASDSATEGEFAPGKGPGSIMADALRRVEELRRDSDDDYDNVDKESVGKGWDSVGITSGSVSRQPSRSGLHSVLAGFQSSKKTRLASGSEPEDGFDDSRETDEQYDSAGADGENTSVGRRSDLGRYLPPKLRWLQGARAGGVSGAGTMHSGEGEVLGGVVMREQEKAGDRGAGGVKGRSERVADPTVIDSDVLQNNMRTAAGPLSHPNVAPSIGSSTGSNRSRVALVQHLDEEGDEEDSLGPAQAGWRRKEHVSAVMGADAATALTTVDTAAAAAPSLRPAVMRVGSTWNHAATAVVAMGATGQVGRSSVPGGAVAAKTPSRTSFPSRTELMKAIMFSRKPSAPLLPVQAPRRRDRKHRAGQQK